MTIASLLFTSLLLLTKAAARPPLTGRDLSRDELVEYYKQYDHTSSKMGFSETPDSCDYEENQYNHCPKDQSIPCSSVENIVKFCEENLGEEIVEAMKSVESSHGLNALTGCVKYVGYHVVEHGHYACCDSVTCDSFINDQISHVDSELDKDENEDEAHFGFNDVDDDDDDGYFAHDYYEGDDDDDDDDDNYGDEF